MDALCDMRTAATSGSLSVEAKDISGVLLIIPCFNEARAIGGLLNEIVALDAGYHTIVVDDGSHDETFRIASAKSKTVRLVQNLGIGGAVQTGLIYSARAGYDFCVQIDGDGQHCPDQIEILLSAYAESPKNIIIGSRYLNEHGFKSTKMRRAGTNIIAWTLRRLFNVKKLTDPTSGMRLMDRDAIAFLAEQYPHDFPEPISLAWALRRGLTIGEASVTMREREYGNSSIIGLKPIAYMIRVLAYIILARVLPPK